MITLLKMKYLFLLAFSLCGVLEISTNELTWGQQKSGDDVMLSGHYKQPSWKNNAIQQIKLRVPYHGRPECYNITWISLENLNEYDAKMETNGGVGKSFVELLVQYPKGAPSDVVVTVNGVKNGPCKKKRYFTKFPIIQ